jgi:hypothetical protein
MDEALGVCAKSCCAGCPHTASASEDIDSVEKAPLTKAA